MTKIVLHLKKRDVGWDLRGRHLQFYAMLREITEDRGIPLEVRARDPDIRVGTREIKDDRLNDGNLHIIDDRSVCAPYVLNAGVAYFWRDWHLDAQGVKAFSSVGTRSYDADQISYRRARAFFDNMRQRYVQKRKSKYEQPSDVVSFSKVKGAVSVFFQGDYPRASGATDTCDLAMLRTVMEQTGDRPIIVKLHPKASKLSDIEAVGSLVAIDDRLLLSTANVHDILKASVATVSINSTVALEGFLHRKPAILFGVSDFHHFVSTVSNELRFEEAFARELERKEGYEQYLSWYFLKNCLSLNSGNLTSQIWAKFRAAGFPEERF
ncbi:hypothetical protein Q5Y75_11625 [Ruegeria sp. 2205SS24-7]|uniref:capsular polysaccharide export protein, LipB/KpsS family n=1 Tax=Ruegeria discodermiae TaxID=3064389 RepID=UPI002741BFAB|nr:hypothetical protein [Ruegeria sp. 2205SS24-7]MDP5217869.1 hypothetical protein [Ruegeria sp. 2205SS24-7]